MKHSTVKQPVWKNFTEHFLTDDLRKSLALDIGLKILAGGSSSLLYEKLVKKKKNFSVVGGYYQGLTKGREAYICMLFQKQVLIYKM